MVISPPTSARMAWRDATSSISRNRTNSRFGACSCFSASLSGRMEVVEGSAVARLASMTAAQAAPRIFRGVAGDKGSLLQVGSTGLPPRRTNKVLQVYLRVLVLLADNIPLGYDLQQIIDIDLAISSWITAGGATPPSDDRKEVVDIGHSIRVAVGRAIRLQGTGPAYSLQSSSSMPVAIHRIAQSSSVALTQVALSVPKQHAASGAGGSVGMILKTSPPRSHT